MSCFTTSSCPFTYISTPPSIYSFTFLPCYFIIHPPNSHLFILSVRPHAQLLLPEFCTHAPEADTMPSRLVPSDSVCLHWLKWVLCSSSVSIPSSMDVSVTVPGNKPLALRTTTGGRGSSRQPSTWRADTHPQICKYDKLSCQKCYYMRYIWN